MKNNKLRNGILIGAVVLLALIAGTSAVTIVPAGHTGVIVTMGKVSDRVLSEGMHLKVPFAQQIVMMNNKIQKTEIDSNGVSKDLQTVSSGVAINYHINKDDSAKIYQSIGEGYADTVLQPAIQESMKAITAQYTAEELITKTFRRRRGNTVPHWRKRCRNTAFSSTSSISSTLTSPRNQRGDRTETGCRAE